MFLQSIDIWANKCMTRQGFKLARYLGLSGAITLTGCFLSSFSHKSALAQITPDATLGAEPSIVTPLDAQGLPVDRIDGGAIRGTNLFHSFLEFNVAADRGAYFFSPANIENILTRVTGSNASQIFGTLGTFGASSPNLFLINPNGIIFGQNASLDVGGSFVTTTASAIQFGNQGFFSASTPEAPALLTVNPSAFFFNQISAGRIENRSIAPAGFDLAGFPLFGLRVPDGRSLLLIGGNIVIDGGQVNALGGRVELAGVAGLGTVDLIIDANNLSLSVPEAIARADVSLKNRASLYVAAENGGSITINAQNIDILERSFLLAGIEPGQGTDGSQAGDITLNAKGAIAVEGSNIFNVVGQEAVGNAGNITIKANSLFLTNNAQLGSLTIGQGNAGNVLISANTVTGDESFIGSNVNFGGVGNAGNVTIDAGTFFLTNGASASSSTRGRGNAGSVTITADTVSFDGVGSNELPSGAFSQVQPRAEGNGSNVTIEAGTLFLTNGAQVNSSTFANGNAGNVTITANAVILDGESGNGIPSGISSSVEPRAIGDGGNVTIKAKMLSLANGSQLSSATFAQGNAGNVTITADTISLDNGVAASSVEPGAEGKGGNVTIEAKILSLTNGAQLSSATFAQGNAGNVTITADTVSLDGEDKDGFNSAVGSSVEPGAKGNGGTITISTRTLSLTNGAQLSSSTFAQGNAGNVMITADTVSLDGKDKDGTPSAVGSSVQPRAEGNGGTIALKAENLSFTNGAGLSANTLGEGDAGKIEINVNTFEAASGGRILSDTSTSGRAGDIIIQARERFTLSGVNTGVFASTGADSTGIGGSIELDSPEVTLSDRAAISVSSKGAGIGGNIEIQADTLTLQNQARLLAETASNTGGNITLRIQDLLLLRYASKISTTAGTDQAGGDGGNITIDADFIVGVPKEDSDITANAFQGQGGNINITTQGIYGLQFRPRLTPLSDITASSEFGLDGEFQLDLLTDVDPSRGLAQLPTNVVDASDQIDRRCTPVSSTQERNSFTITGRGGLPPSPHEPLQSESIITNWVTLDSEVETKTPPAPTIPQSSTPKKLVEAQGWMLNHKGEVVLTASAPTVTPNGEWFPEAKCDEPSVERQ
jgi:filamentous hemagglutinin family protein